MKKLLLLLLCSCSFLQAQYLIEDNDITENIKETGRQIISYDMNNPMEFYRLKCDNATYAQFPGGENAFKKALSEHMKSYLDSGVYSVNGTFEIILFVTKDGRLQRIQLKPEVPNSNFLYRDLELSVRSVKSNWTPAECNGIPVDSKIRQKINFRTDGFDF